MGLGLEDRGGGGVMWCPVHGGDYFLYIHFIVSSVEWMSEA